jgi:hypothetical protein
VLPDGVFLASGVLPPRPLEFEDVFVFLSEHSHVCRLEPPNTGAPDI